MFSDGKFLAVLQENSVEVRYEPVTLLVEKFYFYIMTLRCCHLISILLLHDRYYVAVTTLSFYLTTIFFMVGRGYAGPVKVPCGPYVISGVKPTLSNNRVH